MPYSPHGSTLAVVSQSIHACAIRCQEINSQGPDVLPKQHGCLQALHSAMVVSAQCASHWHGHCRCSCQITADIMACMWFCISLWVYTVYRYVCTYCLVLTGCCTHVVCVAAARESIAAAVAVTEQHLQDSYSPARLWRAKGTAIHGEIAGQLVGEKKIVLIKPCNSNARWASACTRVGAAHAKLFPSASWKALNVTGLQCGFTTSVTADGIMYALFLTYTGDTKSILYQLNCLASCNRLVVRQPIADEVVSDAQID